MAPNGVTDIVPVIQLAIAPVFLLTAVGTLISVLTNRLARAVDRSRTLQERLAGDAGEASHSILGELETLRRRMRLIYLAMSLDVICALFVGLMIVAAFIDALIQPNLARLIAFMFVIAMVAFIASLAAFLREIFLAVGSACARGVRP